MDIRKKKEATEEKWSIYCESRKPRGLGGSRCMTDMGKTNRYAVRCIVPISPKLTLGERVGQTC